MNTDVSTITDEVDVSTKGVERGEAHGGNSAVPAHPKKSKMPEPSFENEGPPTSNDLERLRDILYGNQARGTEKRLEDLERNLAALRQELTSLLNDKVKSVDEVSSNQTLALKKELTERSDHIEKSQASQLRQVEQRLSGRIESQAADSGNQLRELQRDLTARLDSQESDYSAQVRALHQEMNERLEEMTETFLNQIRKPINSMPCRMKHVNGITAYVRSWSVWLVV